MAKYKAVNSFISWVGGKSRLRARITPQIPSHACYCEPFMGAAWVLFGKDPKTSRLEVLNDVNGDLVNLFICVKYHTREILRQIDLLLPSRKIFQLYLNNRGITDIQRAAVFYYIIRNAFGAKVDTPSFGRSKSQKPQFNPDTLDETIRSASRRLSRVIIENLDFERCIRMYDAPATFFFCDPPYFELSTPYAAEFGRAEHERLAELLKDARGSYLLTVNDHPAIRELYAGANIVQVESKYTITQGDPTAAPQLFISNYDLPEPITPPSKSRKTRRKAA